LEAESVSWRLRHVTVNEQNHGKNIGKL
jgi:hypothetical protein